jgi:prolipoprotein diacylglyceryltransferase
MLIAFNIYNENSNRICKLNQVEFENGMLLNMGQLLSIPFLIAGLYSVAKKYFPQSS